jgi:hypothetical protein
MFLALAAVAANAQSPAAAGSVAVLHPPCGTAWAGRMVSADPADAEMAGKAMTMHVRVCDAGEVQIPFHVGDDRSRTWFLTAVPGGVRLKHRHRHADGSLDVRTFYGGDGPEPRPLPGGGWRAEFPADLFSKQLFTAQGIPQSAANVWVVEHVPGRLFAYELRRPGRHFRVEFDLTRAVALPPAPWGDEGAATR